MELVVFVPFVLFEVFPRSRFKAAQREKGRRGFALQNVVRRKSILSSSQAIEYFS